MTLEKRLGYDLVSRLVKQAITENKTFREVLLEKKFVTEQEFDQLI